MLFQLACYCERLVYRLEGIPLGYKHCNRNKRAHKINCSDLLFSIKFKNEIKLHLVLQVRHSHIRVVTSCVYNSTNVKIRRGCHCGGLMRNIHAAKFPAPKTKMRIGIEK